jgi:hypothetical protein
MDLQSGDVGINQSFTLKRHILAIMTSFTHLIKNNNYITECKSNIARDPTSLSSLISRKLSQSDCIKLGIGIEKVLVDIVTDLNPKLRNVKRRNEPGKKEKDHLFINHDTKTIYYAELKSNINLDTEKSRATYRKCLSIVEKLPEEFPEQEDYSIKWGLLALRYIDAVAVPPVIKNKYTPIEANLMGTNQYLAMLEIDFRFTEETYIAFLNEVADAMFES